MKGRDRFLRKMRFYASSEFAELAGGVVFEASDAVRSEAHNSITRGAVSGAGHVASAPGEPPNEDTGDLRTGVTNAQTGPLTAQVKASAAHSRPLEFGTSKIAARPFMRPARDKAAPAAIKEGLRKMNREIRRKTRA